MYFLISKGQTNLPDLRNWVKKTFSCATESKETNSSLLTPAAAERLWCMLLKNNCIFWDEMGNLYLDQNLVTSTRSAEARWRTALIHCHPRLYFFLSFSFFTEVPAKYSGTVTVVDPAITFWTAHVMKYVSNWLQKPLLIYYPRRHFHIDSWIDGGPALDLLSFHT